MQKRHSVIVELPLLRFYRAFNSSMIEINFVFCDVLIKDRFT